MPFLYHSLIFFCFGLMLLACSPKKNEHQAQNGKKLNKNISSVNLDCYNCGMPTQDFKNWNVDLKTAREEIHFCSPRCFFIVNTNPQQQPKNIQEILVKDYYKNTPIVAQKAFYVVGSDVSGPMGSDFVPHQNKESAEEFLREHKGKEVLEFSQINAEIVKTLLKK